MKKVIVLILILFISGSLFCQTLHQAESFELNATVTGNQIYEASRYIKLLEPGFHYVPQANETFVARINPFLIFPPTGDETGGPNPGDDGVVGNFGGELNINQIGSANYTLLIDIPKGINNLQPNLSISYNNSLGDGYMGMGWSISCYSSISRVGCNIYNDTKITIPNFGTDDKFALDGNRLMTVEGSSYGGIGTKYKTEIEDFSIVITHKDEGSTSPGPDWFEVRTKSGLIMQYGKTTDSRIEPQGTTAKTQIWLLNEVKDMMGNYMTYQYVEDNATGEYYLDNISYTGNKEITPTNIAPFAQVVFQYENRPNTSIRYSNGYKTTVSKLLDKININYDNQLYKEYDLIYEFSNPNSLLTEIHLKSKGSEKINPIKFQYSESFSTPVSEQLSESLPANHQSSFADYNGDGLCDLLFIEYPITDNSKWGIKINKNGSFDAIPDYIGEVPLEVESVYPDYTLTGKADLISSNSYGGNAPSPSYFIPQGSVLSNQVTDFNGDGKSDIVIVTKYDEGIDHFYIYKIYYYDENANEIKLYNNFYTTIRREHTNSKVYLADVDGDMLTDFIIFDTDNPTEKIKVILHKREYGQQSEFVYSNFCHWNIDSKVDFADFDGDGKADCMVRNPNGITVFSFNYQNYDYIIHKDNNSAYFPSYNSKLYMGDYNGDGLTDVFEEKKESLQNNDTYYYQLKYFNGIDFVDATYPLLPYPPISVAPYPIFITDLNHDGKSDIALYLYHKLHLFVSNGNEFFHDPDGYWVTNILDVQNSYYGDFNGDGIVDIYQKPGNIIHLNKNDKSRLLENVTDSYGGIVKINYDYLTNNNMYSRTPVPPESFGDFNSQVAPRVHHIQISQPVVSSVETENGLGAYNTKSFTYSGLSLHIEGKGLLGFRSIRANDIVTNTFNYSTNTIDPDHFISLPSKSESGFLSNYECKTNETFFDYLVHDQSNNRIFPVLNTTLSYNRTPENTFISSSLTINEYDATEYLYGNVTKVTTLNDEQLLTSDPTDPYKYKSVTDILYEDPDLENWVISRVKSNTTTSKVPYPDAADITKTTSYEYYLKTEDSYPLLKKRISFSGNLELVEEFSYDEVGNLIKTIQSAPNYINPKTGLGLAPRETNYDYDVLFAKRFLTKEYNSVLSKEITYYPESGLPKEITDANGLKTNCFYDGFNRLTKTIAPNGAQNITVYRWKTDQTGYPTNTLYYSWNCQSGSSPILTFFDKFGRVIGTSTKSFNNSDVLVIKAYDEAGRVKYLFEPNNQSKFTEQKYNTYGQLEQVIYPGDPNNRTVNYSYFARGNTVTDALGFSTTKKVNALGWLEESTDQKNKSVKYEYFADGQVKRTYIDGIAGSDITNIYDEVLGTPIFLTDPDGGTMEYLYNPFGELIWQKQIQSLEKTVEYQFTYDNLGRKVSQSNFDEGITTWVYDTKSFGKGLVSKISNSVSGHSVEYSYDNLSRVTTETETINGTSYISETHYDALGRRAIFDYPYIVEEQPELSIANTYDYNGFLTSISRTTDQKVLWKMTEMNIKGQITKYQLGNGLETQNQFYPYTNMPFTSQTNSTTYQIPDMEYNWDDNGNLNFRKKWLNQQHTSYLKEGFEYDEMNRLDITKLNGVQTSDMVYEVSGSGNIQSKTGIGTYTYGENEAGIHAVTSVENTNGLVNLEIQNIQYTSFNKVSHITQGTNKILDIWYGLDQQRIRQTKVISGVTTTKTFIGGSLEKVSINGQNSDYYYIPSPTGICAVLVKPASGNSYLRYLYSDYLGSITCTTNEIGQKENEYSYDAWGNRRDPATWQSATSTLPEMLCDRGYTGHEHLTEFGLINMNGRVYDPVLGCMLSPDNYMQAPDFTQNLNRYSYCLNNPLKYKDPSGDFLFMPILYGMAMGGFTNALQQLSNNHSLKNWNWGNFIGATVSGGVGGAIAPSLASRGIGGFKGGLITGAACGFSYSLTSSIINKQESILSNSIKGFAVGGLIGGGIGAIDASLKGQRWQDGRGKVLTRRYITGSGETPENSGYYTRSRLREMNTVSRMRKEYPNSYDPKLPEDYIRQHFEGDIEINGFVFPGDESFYVNVDGENIINTQISGKISATIPSDASSISWGFTGDPYYTQVVTSNGGSVLSEVIVRPDSYVLISGNWRSWNGFLFW
ncbi:MAG: FG-GAP-like repeat-containing protein [Bacteroidota bacterium]